MLNIPKHRAQFISILQGIYSDSELSPLLGFKGGTACYLFYSLPRFSTDLDFNLLRPDSAELLLEKLGNYLAKIGTIRDKYIKERTIFFLYSYGLGERNIKIEISRRQTIDHFEFKTYLGLTLPVMVKEDMFANKLVALTERKRPVGRDLFDINYFFTNGWDFNEEIIHTRTGKTVKEYFTFLVDYIPKNFLDKKLLDGLGEVITEEQKREVKNNLIASTLVKLKAYIL